jgi:hypothetical protein
MMPPNRLPKEFFEAMAMFCEALEMELGDAQEPQTRVGTIHDAGIKRIAQSELRAPIEATEEITDADTYPICKFCGQRCTRKGICEDCGIG